VTVYTPPPAPETIEQSGVGHRLLFDLMLKLIHVEGLTTASALCARSRLPIALISDLIDESRQLMLLETLGTHGRDLAAELRYALTSKGHDWAMAALERSQYVGPAPVSLEAFRDQVEKQRLAAEPVGPEQLMRSFSRLVLSEDLLASLGPAVNSGKSILLYGRSGNGKTAIAEALRDAFRDVIAVPYCIAVDGQIINYFDAHVHQAVACLPPPGDRGRRRAHPRDAGSGVRPGHPVLRSAGAPEGDVRSVPDRRLRPPAGLTREHPQPLDRSARARGRLPQPAHRQEIPGAIRRSRDLLDQSEADRRRR
jgi:hypothetical protein